MTISKIFALDGESMKKGEDLVECHHIMVCGIIEENARKMTILALCLSGSNINDLPHNVTISIIKETSEIERHCSCTAGAGAHCKHIAAALSYIYE